MKTALFALAILIAVPGSAGADNGIVTRESRHSVAETMDRLEGAVKAASGVRIFARIDYRALSGNRIRPNQALIFGGGAVLEALAGTTPPVTVDLPIKIVAWEDADGRTWVSYNSSAYIARRHGLVGRDEALGRYSRAAADFAEKASQ